MKGMLVGAALAIGGVLVGFAFATKADVLAEAKWWDLMTAFGTVGAVIAALCIAYRQRGDQAAADDRAGQVAYSIILPELQLLDEGHIPVIATALGNMAKAPEGSFVSQKEQAKVLDMANRMTLETTGALLEKLPLLPEGRGPAVAEAYGLFVRLKPQLAVIGTYSGEVTAAFKTHLQSNFERSLHLWEALDRAKIRKDYR